MAADGSCGSEHIVAAGIVYGSGVIFSKGSWANPSAHMERIQEFLTSGLAACSQQSF